MQRQGSFSQAEYASKKKQTRRGKFPAEMEVVVPWPRLVARRAPLYPKGERGRPPAPLDRMLRIHFLQQWYALADPGDEEDVFGDAGYTGADKRPELADRDVSWNIAIKRSIIKALPKALRELAEPVERALSQVRTVVEHPFHIVKNRFRHKKLRYRGLKKNTAQLHTLFALANLVIVKRVLRVGSGG